MVAFYNPADQELYKQFQYLPQEQFRLGLNLPKNTEAEAINTTFGLPATNVFTGSNQNNYYTGTTGSLVSGFDQAIADRQNRLEALNMPLEQKGVRGADIVMENIGVPGIEDMPYDEAQFGPVTFKGAPGVYQAGAKNTLSRRINDAIYSLPGLSKPQSARDILESGYTGTGSGPGIMATILSKMDRYSTLPRADQAFIASRMEYTGPTVFGENTTGLSTDPFGINTRSLFGNYAEYTKNRAEELNQSLDKSKANWESKYGSLDNTNQFGKTWSEMNKLRLNMQDFYNEGAADLEKTEEEEYQNRIDKFVKSYKRPGVKKMFDEAYDGTNIHGGNDTTSGTTTPGGGDGGGGIDISGAGTIRSADNDFKGDSGPTTQQESDYGYGSDAGFYARGGLASIL